MVNKAQFDHSAQIVSKKHTGVRTKESPPILQMKKKDHKRQKQARETKLKKLYLHGYSYNSICNLVRTKLELELYEQWRKLKSYYTITYMYAINYGDNNPKHCLPFPGEAMTDLVSISMPKKQGLTLNKHFPPAISDSQMQWLQMTLQ